MKKMIQTSSKIIALSVLLLANAKTTGIIALSVLLLANAKTTGDALGANSATWSPSVTIKNNSDYDLRVELIYNRCPSDIDSDRGRWIDVRLAKGESKDVLRAGYGCLISEISLTDDAGFVPMSVMKIHNTDSIITIANRNILR